MASFLDVLFSQHKSGYISHAAEYLISFFHVQIIKKIPQIAYSPAILIIF